MVRRLLISANYHKRDRKSCNVSALLYIAWCFLGFFRNFLGFLWGSLVPQKGILLAIIEDLYLYF